MNKRLRRFCLFWVLACMAPWPIIFLGISFSNDLGISGSIYSVGSTDVTLYHVALIFTGASLVIGFFQWLALRSFLERAYFWFIATVLGTVIGIGILAIIPEFRAGDYETFIRHPELLLILAPVWLLQSLYLQKVCHFSTKWYFQLKPVAAIALGIGLFFGGYTICLTNIVGLPGAIYGLITAYAFVRMMKEKEEEMEILSQRQNG